MSSTLPSTQDCHRAGVTSLEMAKEGRHHPLWVSHPHCHPSCHPPEWL